MIKISHILHTASITLMIFILSSCTLSEKNNQQSKIQEISLPGWVKSSFGINDKYILNNKGRLDEVYDEFVGGLINDGLLINDSHWIKPTYGNENLLWTYNSSIAKYKIDALLRSKKDFESSEYQFQDGTLNVSNTSWSYSGYSLNISNSDSPGFKSYIFLCKVNNGVSVFYWGQNSIENLHDNKNILMLLKLLASSC